jgi:hypothetical protein
VRSLVVQELTPDFPLFLGGMLAGICLAVAALVWVVALPDSPAVVLAYAFLGLGGIFLGVGVLAALVLWAFE